eukprot:TRINITY_DN44643_c0_g1_i1.p1 TRINITY_DN44643_c0_g1~~TRINITY_DN44643_c0_g1_i1.p1  ORF type:complete len:549 (+),score=54.96 TRINITY_DN44643_c0_g1_i1:52-1698(+)
MDCLRCVDGDTPSAFLRSTVDPNVRVHVVLAFQIGEHGSIVRRKNKFSFAGSDSLVDVYEIVAGRSGGCREVWPRGFSAHIKNAYEPFLLVRAHDSEDDWWLPSSHTTLSQLITQLCDGKCPWTGVGLDVLLRLAEPSATIEFDVRKLMVASFRSRDTYANAVASCGVVECTTADSSSDAYSDWQRTDAIGERVQQAKHEAFKAAPRDQTPIRVSAVFPSTTTSNQCLHVKNSKPFIGGEGETVKRGGAPFEDSCDIPPTLSCVAGSHWKTASTDLPLISGELAGELWGSQDTMIATENGFDDLEVIQNVPSIGRSYESFPVSFNRSAFGSHSEFASVQTQQSQVFVSGPAPVVSSTSVECDQSDLVDSSILETKAIFHALLKKNVDVVERILRPGSGVAVRTLVDSKGSSAFHFWARSSSGVERGLLRIGKMLLAAGASIDAARTTDGMTPLHHAVIGNNTRSRLLDFHKALFLIRHGASVTARTFRGQTPLDLLRMDNRASTVRMATLLAAAATCEHADTKVYLNLPVCHVMDCPWCRCGSMRCTR